MRPERLFVAFVILYFSAALVGKIVYSSFLGGIKPLPLVYALTFLLLLFVGLKIEIRVSSWIFFAAGTVLLVVLGWPYLLGGLAALALLKFLMDNNALERGVAPAVVVSIALVIIASVLGGVPLLNPSLRFTWVRYLYLAAGYITVGAVAAKPSLIPFIVGEGIAVAGTSRTIGVGVAVAYLMGVLYRSAKTKRPYLRKVLPIVALLLLIVFLARYSATVRGYSVWKLGFLGSLLYRPASSYTVYERLFQMGMPLGRHRLLFMDNPTYYVGRLFGKEIGYTYTLIGEPAYDFGIFGLLEALLIGTLLRKASKNPFTGAFALTVGTLMLDIGVEGTFLATLFYLAYLSRGEGDESER